MHFLSYETKQCETIGGKKFTAYKARFGGLKVDVKFKKDVKPKIVKIKDKQYLCVDEDKINISQNDLGYPVLWVK